MKRLSFIICCLLLLCTSSMQAQNDFNPTNPADPQVPVFYYPLTVACQPEGAAYTSGKGNYAPEQSVTVSTSAKSGYTFNHWELNGERYEATGLNFNYTSVAGPMDFVAVYDFTPSNPNEPTLRVKSRLYLTSEPEGVCTFNQTSGAYVEAEQYVSLNITGTDPLHEFVGWFLNGTQLTDVQNFNYLADYNDVTLVARFKALPFNPESPADPSHVEGQEDVQTHAKGDTNEDGTVDVADAVAIINIYLTGKSDGLNTGLADANGDGVIDIADAVYVINIYLTNQ